MIQDNPALQDAQVLDTYIKLWESRASEDGYTLSEPSLALAIGLDTVEELKELEESRPDLTAPLKRARTVLASYWFGQLRRPSREINVAGPIFALKAQLGYRDTDKAQKTAPINVNIYSDHAKKL